LPAAAFYEFAVSRSYSMPGTRTIPGWPYWWPTSLPPKPASSFTVLTATWARPVYCASRGPAAGLVVGCRVRPWDAGRT